MKDYTTNKRYCPHLLDTKLHAVALIEEVSRKRFIYAYQEKSSYSTIDFIKRAITYFGYAPKEIQTDCGGEFTHTAKTERVHQV